MPVSLQSAVAAVAKNGIPYNQIVRSGEFSRTYGGRNTSSQIATDAKDLYKAAEVDLDSWEPIWRHSGWSTQKIAEIRQKVHLENAAKFKTMGLRYGP